VKHQNLKKDSSVCLHHNGVRPHQCSVPCPTDWAHPLALTIISLLLYTLHQQEHHPLQT